ncbi:MAG: rhomboid family intramembrane serine protease [Candidatus Kapaibacterium sp.]
MSRNFGGGRMSAYSMFTPAIKTIIIINVLIFILQKGIFPGFQIGDLTLEQVFTKYSALWQINSGLFYVWQLVTYQFMHGGIGHIFFNMYGLYLLGSEIEYLWGSKRFTWFYLLSGIGAGLTHMLFHMLFHTNNPYGVETYIPNVGASGSIFGVMLAFAYMFPERELMIFPLFIPIRARIFVGLYIGLNLLQGITGTNQGVAVFAHLGGALTGFLLIKFGDKVGIFGTLDKLTGMFGGNKETYNGGRVIDAHFKERTVETEQSTERKVMFHGGTFFHNGEQITPEIVDSILDKINVVGFDNLTDREKEILREVSRRMS